MYPLDIVCDTDFRRDKVLQEQFKSLSVSLADYNPETLTVRGSR